MESIDALYPSEFWKWFDAVTKIPRPSRKEAGMIHFLDLFAKERNLPFIKDIAGNVLIKKEAAIGYENRQPVILQAHMDMVCEKNIGVIHDFEKDPISYYEASGWIRARGTTLGADDGAGLAAMLAILDGPSRFGPLSCLFTVDEETGLTGARMIQNQMLPANILINLDSGDEGEFYAGCAGGVDTTGYFSYKAVPAEQGGVYYRILVTGLTGGHSGDDIDKGLANSVKLLTRVLRELSGVCELKLCQMDAGNLRNAIPREGSAMVMLQPDKYQQVADAFNMLAGEIAGEYASTEPNLSIRLEPCEPTGHILSTDSQRTLLDLLNRLPHGVVAMSKVIPGLVETSTNLASVKFEEENIAVVGTSQRSSLNTEKDAIAEQVNSIFIRAGAVCKHSTGYPGWAPNPDSAIIAIGKEAYRALFSQEPRIKAIHAGLECGLFLEKNPALDMISIGPTMKGCHSPDERLEVASVGRFWDLLMEMLRTIPVK